MTTSPKLSRDEIVSANCRPFAPFIFDNLPETVYRTLAPIVENSSQFNEKSLSALLLGNLTNFSSLIPGVTFLYGVRRYSTNISFIYISPSGTNKGVIPFGQCITSKVDAFIQQQSRARKRKWESDMLLWEQEKKLASRENRPPDMSKDPGPCPQLAVLCMSSSTSKKQLIECIKSAEKYGLIISSTEINSLVDAMEKDYGNFADILCKALVNEKVDRFYAIDEEPISIERPMLSIALTGTFDQFQKLIQTFEDGLASRIFMFVGESNDDWISQRPNGRQKDYTPLYDEIGSDAMQMWQFYSSRQMEVLFTESQWDKYDAVWSERRRRVILESGTDLTSIANRHPMMAFRIASTLTAIRYWESIRKQYAQGVTFDFSAQPDTLICSDTDFDIATEMATTLFEHVMQMTTTKVNKEPRGSRPMVEWRWSHQALESMPDEFTAKDFIDTAHTFDRSEKTAYYTLNSFCKQGIIKKNKNLNPVTYIKNPSSRKNK